MSNQAKEKTQPAEEDLLKAFPFRPELRYEEIDLFLEAAIDLVSKRLRDLKFGQETNDIHRRSLMDKVRKWIEFTFYLCEVSHYYSVRRTDLDKDFFGLIDGRYGRRK